LEPVEIIRQSLNTLHATRELLQWAHNDGYLALVPNPDRPTHVPPPPQPGAPKGGPDDQPGPTHDIGVGSHSARMAYGTAVVALASADSQIVAATALATGKSPKNEGVEWDGGVPLPAALRLSVRVAARLRRFEALAGRRQMPEHIEARVLRACSQIHRAHDLLTKALNKGPADPASEALLAGVCRICGFKGYKGTGDSTLDCPKCRDRVRNAEAKRKARRKEGKKQRERREGTAQRQGVFRSALEAQQRRLARGEDHGDESFGCVVVHEGGWPTENPGPGSKGAA
jgi:hypothetical protein